MEKFNIIANSKTWLESSAVSQIKSIADYPGVLYAAGLPDLHAGRTPVGIAVITDSHIYPYLIGNDIGCGMGLFKTNISLKRFKMEKWQNQLRQIKELGEIPAENPFKESSPIHDLGTIGGGNHFAEFQKIEKIYCPKDFELLNIAEKEVLLLIHSGSRAYGQQIMSQFTSQTGYAVGSNEAKEYLKLHAHACLWALRNREVVANKLITWLGFTSKVTKLIDCVHNYVEHYENTYIQRKGATSALNGMVIIPGSRGAFTYLVKPVGDSKKSAYSLSHGAGRKWIRSLCKGRINNIYDRETIRQTALKSRVVCQNTELLYQEAPEVYKNISNIIDVLVEYGLIEVVATLRPLLTYKG